MRLHRRRVLACKKKTVASNILTVTSAAGSASGKTTITVSETLGAGNSFKYKVGDGLVLPSVGDSCTTGYTAWNGSDEITAATGKTIVIVEVDSDNKAVRVGSTTVTAK